MNFTFSKEHIDKFKYSLKAVPRPNRVRIMVDGQYIEVLNGKTVWKTIGHAKAALLNHFRNGGSFKGNLCEDIIIFNTGDKYSRLSSEIWAAFLQELQDKKILEFVTD